MVGDHFAAVLLVCGNEADSAMSYYSFLAKPRQTAIAISSSSAKQMSLHETEGFYRVEVWKYDPIKLSSDEYADMLSVILSYKDSDDERIDKEIEYLENKIV
jgi:hypothetical protein